RETARGHDPAPERLARTATRYDRPHRARGDGGPQDDGREDDGRDGREDDGPRDEHDAPRGGRVERASRRISWRELTFLPFVLALALLGTWIYYDTATLDVIARNSLGGGNIWLRVRQHIQLTVISTFFVLIIAIPLGILLTRQRLRKAAPVAVAFANIGQATPALGLLALLVIWLGTGEFPALVGIIIYAILPVLSNTIAGLRANDPTLLEAARGIGMSPLMVLGKVELPLAVPLILSGVRTALVLNVGTATLATFGGGGGLGDIITAGITNQRMSVLVIGSILTIVLALLVDWLASLAELLLRPRGLEVSS
ncbi:ABC transporter permease, partial [Streptomyces sp. SA3_actF]